MIVTPREFSSLTVLTESAAQAARTAHDELTKLTPHPLFHFTANSDKFKSGVWVDNKGEPISIPISGIVQSGARLGPYGNQSDKPRSKWDEKGILSMRHKLDLGPPATPDGSRKTTYCKAFNDCVRYVLNLQEQSVGNGPLTHASVIKPQKNINSAVEYDEGSWILRLTADVVKRLAKPADDPETDSDVQAKMGSLFDNDESEDEMLGQPNDCSRAVNYSVPPTLHARPDRDPEGFFHFLTPKQKKSLVYCEDVDYYDTDGTTLDFDDVHSLLQPGDFVLIWAEMRLIDYLNTKTFQLVMNSVQTFGPALDTRLATLPLTPSPSVLGRRVKREETPDIPRAAKRGPIVPQSWASRGGSVVHVNSDKSYSGGDGGSIDTSTEHAARDSEMRDTATE